MFKKVSGIMLWILIFQLVGYLIGRMTQVNIATWYQTLNKSVLNPPDFIFPIVWGILYIMIAIAGWWLWQNRKKHGATAALFFYVIQVLMNWAWTPIFFQYHLIKLGFYWIIAIIVLTLITILLSLNKFKFAAIMLIPYWFWLLFASYLNYAIWMKN